MKYNTIKIISTVMLLVLLLGAFSSCGNRVSAKEKEKIEKAFLEQKGIELELTLNEKGEIVESTHMAYYGKFGGAHVFFQSSIMCAIETKRIANEKIYNSTLFNIWVYKNGKIYTIEEAYDKWVLSKSDIADIARCHYKYRIVQNAEIWPNDRRFYGSYKKCDVGFTENGASEEGDYNMIVAGYEFKHNKEFSISGYAAGDNRKLDWLYENGYLTENDIKKIYELHSSFYEG